MNNTQVGRELALPVDFPGGTWLTDLLGGGVYPVEGETLRFAPLEPRRAWILRRGKQG